MGPGAAYTRGVSFFDRFRKGKEPNPSGRGPSAKTLADLKEFLATRDGVEGYIEPPTSVYAMTLCLVAADGEHLRRAVKDLNQAQHLCDDHGVPLYDARRVGYPERMKRYAKGLPADAVRLEDLPPLDTTESEPNDTGRDDD